VDFHEIVPERAMMFGLHPVPKTPS
jgi:hypothetical protein